MNMTPSFTLGVNYWPRRKAMYWWKEFDRGEVRAEFAHIADMGFDTVRFFLLWEDFQPRPGRVNTRTMGYLETALDAAADAGLRTMPTLFVGNMSGAVWYPDWAVEYEPPEYPIRHIVEGREHPGRVRDFYTHPGMVEAQLYQIEQIVGVFGEHPAVWGWDLGNESDAGRWPSSAEVGRSWLTTMLDAIRENDPDAVVTYGAHAPSLARTGLRIDHLAEAGDFACVHPYPFYSCIARRPLDTDFVLYVNALAESLAGGPVLVQEFGCCTAAPGDVGHEIDDDFDGQIRPQYLASQDEQAQYLDLLLHGLYEAGALGAWIWCYADYAEHLWARPPCDRSIRERTFGLVRRDGAEKPAAGIVRAFAWELRHEGLGEWGRDRRTSELDPDEYYADPASNFSRGFERFLEGADEL